MTENVKDSPQQGDEDETIEQQTAIPLPARQAMSVFDPPLVSQLFPGDPVDPPTTTGQGIDERGVPE
jgi:hypothetical protein